MLGPTATDEARRALERLQERYEQGKLEYVVGAGTSMASGLPGWTALNLRLLEAFFETHLAAHHPEPEELAALAETFASWFGQSAAVDFVREELQKAATGGESTAGVFESLLRAGLYGSKQRLENRSIQYELMAAIRPQGAPRGLYTFNFDDLLESAAARLFERRAQSFTEPDSEPGESPWVAHLHGMLTADGRRSGSLILSEKDYLGAAGDWADRRLQDLFEEDRDLLLVGLSLADPRLRSLLYKRMRERRGRGGKGGTGGPNVYALMSREPKPVHPDLARRRAYRRALASEIDYWRGWEVELIQVARPDLVPSVLRTIRLGSRVARWLELARAHLRAETGYGPALFEPAHQEHASRFLRTCADRIRARYGTSPAEVLSVSSWLPTPFSEEAVLKLCFRSEAGSGASEFDTVISPDPDPGAWELAVGSVEEPQGAAGLSFVQGVEIEALVSSPQMDFGFDADKAELWRRSRDFAALWCIPVLGSRQWVPLGVVCVTSNRKQPFWTGLDSEDRLELNAFLRQAFRSALETES